MLRKSIFFASLALLPVLIGSASADLLARWNLDEGSGTTATDSSGNGRDGTFTGEPQWVSGYNSASALHFDGIDDFAVHSLDEAQNFDAFSVALWVKADTLGQPVYCSPFSSHYPNTAGFQVDVDGGNPGNYRNGVSYSLK